MRGATYGRLTGFVFAGWIGAFTAGAVAAQPSPYAGMEQREIKALSPEAVAGYLAGEGMGFAKAAELNSYPGPKHVLELSEPLSLSADQAARTRRAFDEMHRQAVRLGESLIARERELDVLFAAGDADPRKTRAIVTKIARLHGELRLAHLDAHLKMREILSEDQIQAYDALRGYASRTHPSGAPSGQPKHGEPGGPGCDAHGGHVERDGDREPPDDPDDRGQS